MIYTVYLIPILIISVGVFMYKYPPKKPNLLVGYRTRRSMHNEKNWEKANKYCGELFIKVGLIMLLIAFILWGISFCQIMKFSEDTVSIIAVCQVIPIILAGILVENKIKNINNEEVK